MTDRDTLRPEPNPQPSPEANPELSQDELAQHNAEELPDRDNLSLINLNAAVPINAAAALNVLSDGSAAGAGALQQDPINQGI